MEAAKRGAQALAAMIVAFLLENLRQYLGIEFATEQADLILSATTLLISSVVVGILDKLQQRFPWLGFLSIFPTRPRFLSKDDCEYIIESISEVGKVAYGSRGNYTADLIQKLK